MIKATRSNITRPRSSKPSRAKSLQDWPADMTRTESAWSNRPHCPLLPRTIAAHGFLRDRLHMVTGAKPLPGGLSDMAVDATLSLMLRRGK